MVIIAKLGIVVEFYLILMQIEEALWSETVHASADWQEIQHGLL